MKKLNLIYEGYQGKSALYDIYFADDQPQSIYIFVHGYMGYKDWGAWNLMAESLQRQGKNVAMLNLTSNGTTLTHPKEFVDLKQFGNGGYYKELCDVRLFIDHLKRTYNCNEFQLIGHSRGGGIVLLAGQDTSVKAIHCLAPIASIKNRFPTGEDLEKWKLEGVYYRKNGRTGQDMPHYYVQYEEFLENQEELDIEKACKKLKKPVFVYHGDEDSSVPLQEGRQVSEWSSATLHVIQATGHTFDVVEPWNHTHLPPPMLEVVELIASK